MAGASTLKDFQALLGRLGDEALDEMGRTSAKITSDAARRGGLSNNRIVFLYTDALLNQWHAYAARVIADLRQWNDDSALGRSALRDLAEAELRSMLPKLIDASRATSARGRFQNKTMLKGAADQIAGLEEDLEFPLRRFDIKMDQPPVGAPALRQTGVDWQKWGTIIAGVSLLAVLIIALLGGG